jgi:DEAD/DEAH box helicase domain-containing protein
MWIAATASWERERFMASRNILILDLETQKSFKEVGRSKHHSLEKLKVSVAGVYDYAANQFLTYEEKEMMSLEKRLREIDLLVGFNIKRFDLPVLAPYLFMPVVDLPVLDLLEDIEKARGHRASLDSIARPTLHQHKSGNGADALIYFRENRMEELKKYCLEDVRLTKEIYEYGCREGKVLFTSTWDYQTYEIPVNWKQTAEAMLEKNPIRERGFPTSLF